MSALGYILIFYIGFYYYRLAENYNRNKWLFGFLGILFYFLGAILYPLYIKIAVVDKIDEYDLTFMSLKSLVIGLTFVFIIFHLLELTWKKKNK